MERTKRPKWKGFMNNTPKILALDPATKFGWAIDRDVYGTWDLTTRKDQSPGFKLLRFRAILDETCQLHGVTVIGYEKPGGRHYRALILHSKLVGEIEKYCEENNIEYKGYSATDIKKFATGKGNSGKPAMVQAAQEKLGYTGDDDNEADALWILELLKFELGENVLKF